MKEKFKIQDDQYIFPYHHLVDINNNKISITKDSRFNYYIYLKEVVKIIEKIDDIKSLIDVGCGDGKLIYELTKKQDIYEKIDKFVGVDLSAKAIQFAKAFCFRKKKVDFENKDISEIQEKYDLVTVIEVLEHISDDDMSKFQRNLFDLVNNRGYILISVPTKNTPVNIKHYRHYTIEMIEDIVKGKNFKIMKTKYICRNIKYLKFFTKPFVIKLFNLSILNNKFFRFSKLLKNILDKNFSEGNEKNSISILILAKKI
jgi:2-polyprenyl-3-methyl-5-hydroxy-6-metoxy-1,4-benzoquinol methylase